MSILMKIKNRKSDRDNSQLPDLYDFSHMTAPRQAKKAAELPDLPDLPNLSSLRSAKKTREEDLPDLISISNQDSRTRESNSKRREQVIKRGLQQLEKYYISHNYNADPSEDFYSVFNREDEKFVNAGEKLTRRSLNKKYTHLKFQAWGLVVVVVLLVVGLVSSLGNAQNFVYTDVNASILQQDKAVLSVLATVEYDESVIEEKFGKYDMKYINQISEGLPNGCESVSLAMALSRYIRDITPHEIVEKYLPTKPIGLYNGVYIGDDPTYYYIGNPAGKGYGIFAEGLTTAAVNTLKAYQMETEREVVNISGCTDEELLSYVAEGYPVIVWCTLKLNPVAWGAYSWHLPTGQLYRYPGNQHCCVLVESTETTVTLYDPTDGTVTYDKALFLQRWGEIGPYIDKTKQAIVIK